jgi:hypothetical protein
LNINEYKRNVRTKRLISSYTKETVIKGKEHVPLLNIVNFLPLLRRTPKISTFKAISSCESKYTTLRIMSSTDQAMSDLHSRNSDFRVLVEAAFVSIIYS